MMHLYIVDIYNAVKNNGLNSYVTELSQKIAFEKEIKLTFVWLNSDAIKECEKHFEDNNVAHIYLSKSWSKFLPVINNSFKHFLISDTANKSNVIFHFNWINHSHLAWQIRNSICCRTVLTKHCIPWRDLITDNYEKFTRLEKAFKKKQPIIKDTQLCQEEISYNSFDKIIALTSLAERSLRQVFTIHESKIVKIWNGIDGTKIKPAFNGNKARLREKYGFSRHEKLIIYAGNIVERKGILDVVRAFVNFLKKDQNSNVRLLIAGPANFQKVLELITECSSKIILLGSLEKQTLYDFYAMCDLGIIPSFVEQCSYTCIEMMYLGLPLIVSDVDGLSEMVNDDCGLRLKIDFNRNSCSINRKDLFNRVTYLLSFPMEAQRLALNAKIFAKKHFTADRMVGETTSVYKELVRNEAGNCQDINPSIEITFIIPSFNSAPFIKETLDSVINQTYGKWRCLLIDDGSTDETLQIINNYARKDSRIVLLSCEEKKKGANASRNIGLKYAKTSYVIFLDDDDILLPTCLEERVKSLMQNDGIDVLIFKTAFINANGDLTGLFPCSQKHYISLIYDFLNHKIQWQTVSPLWKKSFLEKIGGWNEDFERLQDVELNIKALLQNPNIGFVNKPFDSMYRHLPMSFEKRMAALYGFVRLMSEYYIKLTKSDLFPQDIKNEFDNSFNRMAYKIAQDYVALEKIDREWTSFFLMNLDRIELGEKRMENIKNILINYNESGDD